MAPSRSAPRRSAPRRLAPRRLAPLKFLSPAAYAANNSCAVMLFLLPTHNRLAVLRPTFFPKRRGVREMPLFVFDCAKTVAWMLPRLGFPVCLKGICFWAVASLAAKWLNLPQLYMNYGR